MPTTHKATVPSGLAEFIFKIKQGLPVDLGQRIFDELLSFTMDANKLNSLSIPYPVLIYQLLISQGFKKLDSEMEEPRAALLQIDNRFFGGQHFNDMATPSDQDAGRDLSLKSFLQDRMAAVKARRIALKQEGEELVAELRKIERLLLEIDGEDF